MAVEAMTSKLREGELKSTVGDFVKLLDLQQAMVDDKIREMRITWVEDISGAEYSTDG